MPRRVRSHAEVELARQQPRPRSLGAQLGILLAGAGIRGGIVVGKTSDNGQEITDKALSIEDFFQTLCRAMNVDASKELITPEGRPLKIVDGGEPVKELFG